MLVGLMGYLIYAVNEVHVCQSSARTPLCHTEDLQFYSAKTNETQRTRILPELYQSPAEYRLFFYIDSYLYLAGNRIACTGM